MAGKTPATLEEMHEEHRRTVDGGKHQPEDMDVVESTMTRFHITNTQADRDLITKKNAARSPLLKMPAELRDRIYKEILEFREPIEFAPLQLVCRGLFAVHLNQHQYQHAVRFRRDIAPRLSILHVCKQVFEEASYVFYAKNSFRFSNGTGWTALLRFLTLIGAENRDKLRDITVCHLGPTKSTTERPRSTTSVPAFSPPFGLSRFALSAIEEENPDLSCVAMKVPPYTDYEEAIKLLMGCTKLKQLQLLLFHQDWRKPLTWRSGWYDELYKDFVSDSSFALDPIRAVSWARHENRTKTLVNMVCDPLPTSLPRSLGPAITLDLLDRGIVDGHSSLLQAVENARTLFAGANNRGWHVTEVRHSECGYYPLKEGDNHRHAQQLSQEGLMMYCEICCEDYAGWKERKDFEEAVRRQYAKYQEGEVEYNGCVKCWHCPCLCESGERGFLPEGWISNVDFLGNPGDPLHVNADKDADEYDNISW